MTIDAQIAGFLLILTRIVALASMDPFLGDRAFPVRVRLTFALCLTLVLYPMAKPAALGPFSGLLITLLIAREAAVGFGMGFFLKAVFSSASFAGEMAAQQIGLRTGSNYDPATGAQDTVIAQVFGLMSIALFLAFDGHHAVIQVLAQSFKVVPCGILSWSVDNIQTLIQAFSELFILAIRISAPVVAAVLIAQVGLAILAKLTPQFDVFILGFTVAIGVGMITLALSLQPLAHVLQGEIVAAVARSLHFARTF